MEVTGCIRDVNRDWKTGKYNITLSINEASAMTEVDQLIKCDRLDIEVKKHREKRSRDSNSYCWVLMQKLAEHSGIDKWDVYLECLKKYSRAFTHVIVKEDAIDKVKELYRECIDLGEIKVNGQSGHQLQVYFGSSTFDSKEMSVFLDGVVSECKELGIETLPPYEIERMKAAWNQ